MFASTVRITPLTYVLYPHPKNYTNPAPWCNKIGYSFAKKKYVALTIINND